jgi:cation transporter-like permease
MDIPTKGSPLGCLTGLLALFSLGLTALSGYGLFRWIAADAEKRPEGSLATLLGSFAIGLVFFVLLSWVSYRILKSTHWKSYDPDNDTSLHD